VRAASVKSERYRAVRHSLLIEHLKQTFAHAKGFPLLGSNFVPRAALKNRWRSVCGIVISVPGSAAVAGQARACRKYRRIHSARCAVCHPQLQRALRRGSLQFVRQRIVVARIAVVQETTDGAEKFHRTGGQFILEELLFTISLFSPTT